MFCPDVELVCVYKAVRSGTEHQRAELQNTTVSLHLSRTQRRSSGWAFLSSPLFSSSNSLSAHRPSVHVYTLWSHLLFFLTDAQVYCWCVYHAGVLRSLDRDAGNGHRGTLSLLHTLPVYTLFAFIRVWIVNVDDYDYTRPPRKLLVDLLRCKSSYRAQKNSH